MNLHDRSLLNALLRMSIERFNASIDRETLLCPRTDGVKQTGADWPAASERAIAHRLAFYLEHLLIHEFGLPMDSTISVDCEYNRHRQAGKTQGISKELVEIVLAAKRKAVKTEMISRRRSKMGAAAHMPNDAPADSPEFVYSVAPDIVVHHRGVDADNLLVIEIKKATNKEDPRYDDLKLKKFTHPGDYHYELGAAVVATDDLPAEKRTLKVVGIYENGSKTWPKQAQAAS
jgi:hypothetical protein